MNGIEIDKMNAFSLADEAAAQGVAVSAVYVRTNEPDSRVKEIMRNYAKKTGGRYGNVNNDGAGAGAIMLQALDQGDCNCNGITDIVEVTGGSAMDCTANGLLDECEPDCNTTGHADSCDILDGTSPDCNSDGIPDECAQRIIYVDDSATGANTGTSWTDAYVDLQQALAVCYDGVCADREVWVARGTYYPASIGSARGLSFTLCNRLALYGGFDGSETQRDQRDPATNITTLSGDLGRNDASGIRSDNAYHVVYAQGLMTAVIDGFTIRGGNASEAAPADNAHGGGFFVKGGSPTIGFVRFEDNRATLGAAAAVYSGARVTFPNCTFADNIAQFGGGALYVAGNSSSAIARESTFMGNSTGANGIGGAISVEKSATISAIDSVFLQNTSDYGGAISVWHAIAGPVNCTFKNNTARIAGGVAEVSCDPNDHSSQASSYLEVINCVLWGNTSPAGHELATKRGPGTMRVRFNGVEGGQAAIDLSGGGTVTNYYGNVESDPVFADAYGRLSLASPCIDEGDDTYTANNLTDFDGNPRVTDGDGNGTARVDMGAFEAPQALPACNAADVNTDGFVNGSDILSVRAPGTWNMPANCPPQVGDAGNPRADVNSDRLVNGSDILSIRAPGVWNTSTGPCRRTEHCPDGDQLLAGDTGEMSMQVAGEQDICEVTPASVELFDLATGINVESLQPFSRYALQLDGAYSAADYFVIAASSDDAASGLSGAAPAGSGAWADADVAFAPWTSDPLSFATGLQVQQTVAGVLIDVAAASGPLCTVTTGEAGTLRLDVLVIPAGASYGGALFVGDATFVVGE